MTTTNGYDLIGDVAGGSLVRSYMWGNDMSGSQQGAGGVGGLLQVNYYGTQTTNCFAAYDGNGNLSGLVNAADGTVAARYEYGPFGEVIRATGPMAKANPFRFSTEYQDDESDILMYPLRPYSASTGRWLSRDPLGDMAFLKAYVEGKSPSEERELIRESLLSPYQFVHNDPVDKVDKFGLSSEPDVTWAPAPCPRGQIMAFVQVVKGYIWGKGGPHVDNGSMGFGSSGTGCPLYPLPPNMNQVFQDSPRGWTGHLQFIVCRVCLKPCWCRTGTATYSPMPGKQVVPTFTPGYKIVSVGPCVYWKKGDKGDLSSGDFTHVDGPNQDWQVGMDTDFPGASGGKCFTCSGQ